MERTRQYMVRTTIQDQTSFMGFFKKIYHKYIIFTMFSSLVIFLSAGLIFAESDNALFIDESGNVMVGKKLKAKKFEGDGSAITVGGVEFVKQGKGNPPITLEEVVRAVIADMVPIGTIMAYGGDVTNQKIKENLEAQGWLPCDGAKKEVSKYTNLHDIIGNAFGGDGNYFYLPDMRGRFLRGVDHGTNRDPDAGKRRKSAVGGNTGNKVGSVQEDAFKKHSHGYRTNTWFWSEGKTGGHYIRGDHTTNSLHHDRTDEEGNPNETRPKNIHVNWIIKAKYKTSQK